MGAWRKRKVGLVDRDAGREPELLDLRFRALIGRAAWDGLPPLVRPRFSKRLSGVVVALYRGRVVWTEISAIGWLFAQCLAAGRGATSAEPRRRCAGGGVRQRGCGLGRAGVEPVVRTAARLSAGDPQRQALCRGDRAGRICRARDRHGVAGRADGRRPALRQRPLFRDGRGKRMGLPRWLAPGGPWSSIVTWAAGGSFDLALRHPLAGRLVAQHAEF